MKKAFFNGLLKVFIKKCNEIFICIIMVLSSLGFLDETSLFAALRTRSGTFLFFRVLPGLLF